MDLYDFIFVFEEQEYTAKFEKIKTSPVQYHVYDIKPSDFSKGMNLIFFADVPMQHLNWTSTNVNEAERKKENSFKKSITDAIFNKCARENIPVFE